MDVPILVIDTETVGRALIIVSKNQFHRSELLNADAIPPVRQYRIFDWYRNQMFIFLRAVDYFYHYLRPNGFFFPII